jgi:hypothetical protein
MLKTLFLNQRTYMQYINNKHIQLLAVIKTDE